LFEPMELRMTPIMPSEQIARIEDASKVSIIVMPACDLIDVLFIVNFRINP